MEATAFCPAHITGFFKAHLDGPTKTNLENLGSMGAGFSIKQGVTTKVKIEKNPRINHQISKSLQKDINLTKQMSQNLC